LKAVLDDIRRAENETVASAATQVRPAHQLSSDLDFVSKSLTALEDVLRRALTVFSKDNPDLSQTFDPTHLSDVRGSSESELLIARLAESGFLEKREQISLVFVE
jgi:hypothetical protein